MEEKVASQPASQPSVRTRGNSEINSVQHAYTAPPHNYPEFIIDVEGVTISLRTIQQVYQCFYLYNIYHINTFRTK